MNEQTDKLIRDLAAKLGTTAEHLWGVLMRQAPIYSASQLALLAIAIVSAAALFKLTFFFVRKQKETSDDYFFPVLVSSVACAGAVIWFVATLADANLILAGFFNPEYWAFKQIKP